MLSLLQDLLKLGYLSYLIFECCRTLFYTLFSIKILEDKWHLAIVRRGKKEFGKLGINLAGQLDGFLILSKMVNLMTLSDSTVICVISG